LKFSKEFAKSQLDSHLTHSIPKLCGGFFINYYLKIKV
jgi:hypothetical protein